MLVLLRWLLVLVLTDVLLAQDPRKRNFNILTREEPLEVDDSKEIGCTVKSCLKRYGQEELGPFWANRGKKDPTYLRDNLYVQEPHWILVRRDDKNNDNEPFYVTRGKKRINDNDIKHFDSYLWNALTKPDLREEE